MARTILITGASSGIGQASTEALIADGWNVGLFGRSGEKLESLADKLGERAMPLQGDVTKLADVEAAAARLVDRFGQLNAAFANAGKGLDKPGTEAGDPDEWRRLIDTNIMGVLYTARAVLPHLRKAKGHLLMTGSAAGRMHIKGSIYGPTKWFVHGYAGNMADEMREWGGRCTVISPGMVDTAFFDEAKPDKLKPEDIAQAVVFALSQPQHATVREVHVMPTN